MYQDEPYDNTDEMEYTNHPDDDMDDYDEVNNNDMYQEEIDTIISTSTVYKKNRKSKEKKVLEKGEYSTELSIHGKKIKITYFNTGFTPGLTIRHAISGMYEKGDMVGSVGEDLFFKVKRTPGIVNGIHERDPHFLYFYSPTEYENHFACEVSKEVKDVWAQKVKNARRRQLAEEDNRSRRHSVIVK